MTAVTVYSRCVKNTHLNDLIKIQMPLSQLSGKYKKL